MNWFERAQLNYLKFRHKLSPVLFLLSFLLDLKIVKLPDSKETLIFISTHFVLTVCLILLFARAAEGDLEQTKARRWAPSIKILLDIVLQFTFGALASALFVLYFKGADPVSSLPFLVLLASFLFGNEFAHKHTSRIEVRFASTIFLAYAYLIYLVPLFRNQLGNSSLFISTGIAAILAVFFLGALHHISPMMYVRTRKTLISLVVGLFIGLPLLVLVDIIPPLPLMLREGTVAHSIEKRYGVEYNLSIEQQPLYLRLGLPWLRPEYHVSSGETLVFFTAVYAPADIKAGIIHVWEWEDPTTGHYVERSRIPLYVSGGRQNGFRTYSIIDNVSSGNWRVTALLGTGQVLGHRQFTVVNGTPSLVEAVK